MSLDEFGIAPQTILREPVRDRHDRTLKACPECGQPVGDPTTVKISNPDVLDDAELRTAVTRAYTCDAHPYDLVLPVPTDEDASNLGPPWTGVRVRLADERPHHIAIPETEVDR